MEKKISLKYSVFVLATIFISIFVSCKTQTEEEPQEMLYFYNVTKDTAVKVCHLIQPLDGTAATNYRKFTEKESEEKTVLQGTVIEQISKNYTGFTAKAMAQKQLSDGTWQINVYYIRNTITITLNGAGGYFGSKEVLTKEDLYGKPFPSAYTLGLTHAEQYFNGWNTELDGTGESYNDADFTFEQDLTLYAQWVEYLSVTAQEAAQKIKGLSSGSYKLKLTGTLTNDIIKNINSALYANADRLVALDLSETTGLTELSDYAFSASSGFKGTSITKLILPSTVTKIGSHCFYHCKNLVSVEAPGVTVIEEWAFYGCSDLNSVSFAQIMESIDSVCFYNTSLEEITLNAKSLTHMVLGDNKKLKTITIGPNVEQISSFGTIDSGNTALETIIVDSLNYYYKTIDGILYTKDGKILLRCPSNSNITSLAIPKNVTTIGVWAFADCKNLTEINISYTVTYISRNAFYNTTSISSIFIPSTVTKLDSLVFYNWESSQTINISEQTKPSGWDDYWSNYSNAKINWGQTK